MATNTKKQVHRYIGKYSDYCLKTFLILFSVIISVHLVSHIPLAHANTGQDLLSGMGCNDTNKDGTITFDECLNKGKSGTVTSFTDFKGDLTPPDPKGYAPGLTQAQDARTFVLNVTNFALGFLGLIAILIVIYGGFMVLTAASKPEEAGKGKKAIQFAAVGLLIVMSSFAIVNTVLLAPSGNEKGNGAGKGLSATTIRGVAQSQRFNYLADRIDQVMLKIYNSYQFNILMKQQLDNAYTAIHSFEPATSCDIPFSSCINQLDNIINTQLNMMTNSLNDPAANSKYKIGMAALINELTKEKTPAIPALTNASVSENCETLNSGIKANPCTTDNEANIRNDITAKRDTIAAIIPATKYAFLSDGYKQDLLDSKLIIADVYGVINGIATAQIGEKYFRDLIPIKVEMKGNYQYTEGNTKTPGNLELESDSILNQEIDNTNAYLIPTPPLTEVKQELLKQIITDLLQIKSILENIKFVDTVITADVTSGNAPVIVDFSTVGSTDPSGLTIALPTCKASKRSRSAASMRACSRPLTQMAAATGAVHSAPSRSATSAV